MAADWLEEHGQGERAEFIRVQVELASIAIELPTLAHERRNPTGPGAATASCWCAKCSRGEDLMLRQYALRRRERELLDTGHEWQVVPKPLCPSNRWLPKGDGGHSYSNGSWSWKFHRGFVSHVACTATDWLRHGPAIVRQQPVEEVRMCGDDYTFGLQPMEMK